MMTLVAEPLWIEAGHESPTSAAYVGLTETGWNWLLLTLRALPR